MALKEAPHPEEAAKRPSRRTHGARPSNTVPSELLDGVVAHFRPQRVILFGSAARGEAGRESDIDLLVVVDDDTPPEAFSAKSIYQARSHYHGAVDILPCRASVLASRASAKGSFANIVLREGVTVYERRFRRPSYNGVRLCCGSPRPTRISSAPELCSPAASLTSRPFTFSRRSKRR